MTKPARNLYEIARQYLPGGVSASARTNVAIGHPFYVTRGDGSKVYDVDGREYIDMSMSHGASLLGHNSPKVRQAVLKALELGLVCSYETEYHSALAKRITEIVPCAEMIRFAGSGTETIMHALRLARTATGREKIIKFEGHFHGYSDHLFFSCAPSIENAGPPSTPIAYPQSAGIPKILADLIIIVPFNDPAALEAVFDEHGHEVATLILEPVNYDSGCIIPTSGFINLCRELCDQYGVLLFFDEVLTAFRIALGGAQEYFGVTPDLCVLGKALGGGMPISAIAGRHDIMMHLRPVGKSEHSGTFLAHLTAVMAALAALEEYSRKDFYERLNKLGKRFYDGFQEIINQSDVPVRLQYVGPRFGLFFGITEEVTNYRKACAQNLTMMHKFIADCITNGVYFHVSPHHGFSAAHTEVDIDRCLDVIEIALTNIREDFY